MTRAVPADFAARLRAARAYVGCSQATFAERLALAGASARTLGDWENPSKPDRVPSPLVLAGLAPHLSAATGGAFHEDWFWGGIASGNAP